MKTEKEIRARLKKRLMQKQGKVGMGFRVTYANIDAIILHLKWVLGDD